MDKAILKKFAVESRNDLIDKVRSKIKSFYVDEEFNSEQKGDIYILSNTKHSLSLTNETFKKRELLIKRIKELSLEQVIEEAAYTWFNRIIAIRYMEVNDILPLTSDNQSLGIRVLSSKDNTPDPEILKFTNLMNPELDIDFKKEKYVDLKDDNEKFKYILLLVCKKLGRVIPQVFDGITDYIDILMPDNLLSDTGFIAKIVNEISENNFNQVEIIGWLYQYYISEKKDEVFADLKKNIKIKKENIPSATQIFTPDWIVKYMVENTIGRYTDDEFRKTLKYYVDNNDEQRIDEDIAKLKFIDPCCGSGHILVYAFELLYKIYESKGYNKKGIPELILKNNLYGIDIDDRACQLSILSVLLKALEYDKSILSKNIKLNILSIQESNDINENSIMEIKDEDNSEIIEYIIDIFKDAKEYGSILNVKNYEYRKVIDKINTIQNIFSFDLKNKFVPLIEQAILLSQKYDVVVTNPPYMGNRGMNAKLTDYVKKNYNDYKTDMFSVFIKRAKLFSKDNGYYAMITQPTVLFLSSFEKIRFDIIKNQTIISLLHMGRGVFGIDFGSTAFIVKNSYIESYKGSYFRLNKRTFQYIDINDIEKIFLNAKDNLEYKFDFNSYHYGDDFENDTYSDDGILKIKYIISQRSFEKIPGVPFAYWISQSLINDFEEKNLKDYANVITGMTTGNNEKYLKLWYEIKFQNISFNMRDSSEIIDSNKMWFPYSKGGNRRKWFGNYDYLVNWSKSDEFNRSKTTLKELYFKKAITWPFISSGKFSARILDAGFLWDVAGSPCFVYDDKLYNYILAFLNTNIADEILKLINPTINVQAIDLMKLPILVDNGYIKEIDINVKKCIDISREDWNSFEVSWDFTKHPLLKPMAKVSTIKDSIANWNNYTQQQRSVLKYCEEELNKIFIKVYGLSDELTSDIDDKDITIRNEDKERDIKSFISYSVGCMFGRYSLDKDGLIYAGGDFDNVYQKYKKEDGGWAGSSLSNYKYLNDNGNEIELSFEVDNDNIIPITDEAYFSDDIVERFKTFIKTVYGDNTFNENMDFIAEALGKKGTETSEETIRRYFVNDFFDDHVKMYQKRPIYWLLDSGKKNGFKALIYMHRYNENLIPKARLDYLHRVQTTYEKLLSDVNYRLTTELSMTDKKEAKNRQADLNAKLNEIKEYDEKIAHIANQRISIDLDDGVKVNYEKFKDILAKIK